MASDPLIKTLNAKTNQNAHFRNMSMASVPVIKDLVPKLSTSYFVIVVYKTLYSASKGSDVALAKKYDSFRVITKMS